MKRISINTSHFSHEEIHKVVKTLEEWDYDWIVDIDYVVTGGDETVNATFSLDQNNLGEFIHLMYGCGWNGAHGKYDLKPRRGY